jgi:chorismate mutase
MPGGIKGKDEGESYFHHLFKNIESVYADANKFTQRGHVQFTKNLPSPTFDRERTTYILGDSEIDVNDDILSMYLSQLDFFCEPGECSNNFGYAALADIQILDMLSKRIIGGGIEVADAKLKQYPKEFRRAAMMGSPGSDAALMEMLTVHPKEIEVLDRVTKRAESLGMKDPGLVREMFKSVIYQTKGVQIKRIYEVRDRDV